MLVTDFIDIMRRKRWILHKERKLALYHAGMQGCHDMRDIYAEFRCKTELLDELIATAKQGVEN